MTDFSKADFYVGLHESARYLGSILINGSVNYTPLGILMANNELEYEELVNSYLENTNLKPFKEWPHLWIDGRGTDFSYFFYDGAVYCSMLGDVLFDPIHYLRCGCLDESIINTYPRFPKMLKESFR